MTRPEIDPASPAPCAQAVALIQQGIRDGWHPGAQLYVSRHHRTVLDTACGESRPGQPLHTDTLLCWLSAVKPVTAVAVLQLADDGLIDLDAPVADLIPAFGAAGKPAITTRHILTHTGGFRSADGPWIDESWADTLARTCAAPLEPGWIPGRQAGYHRDGAWYVLGELVQRCTGERYADWVRSQIFEPAGMRASSIGLSNGAADRADVGDLFLKKGDSFVSHPFMNTPAGRRQPRPGGNGRGPARELGRFYEDLLAGYLRDESRLLGGATIHAMTARQRQGLFDATLHHTLDWGLGVVPDNQRYGYDTVPYGYGRHASAQAFGHGGAQSSLGMADPAHGLVVALVFNGMPGEPTHQRRIRAIMTALYEDLGLTAEPDDA